MIKKYIIILLITILLLGVFPTITNSQDNTSSTCDLLTMQTVIDNFIGELGKLKTSNESDPVKLANELEDLALGAARLRATCDGLTFAGKAQKLIGPVDFPVGTYRATAKTAGYMAVTITPAQGQCGQGQYMDSSLFLIINGQAANGAETLFISQGCTAMVEISNVQGDWSLSFENLTTNK